VHGQHARGDRHVYASRTRFIPDDLLQLFERQMWPTAAAAPGKPAADSGPRIDLRERMRGMWR
jgi:DNA helicase-2/ATP-dependent DNA helicase PcrA